MAVAMLRPEPEEAKERGKKGGRGKKAPINGEVSSQRLADARAVLTYSREHAEAVIREGKPLHAALAETRQSQGTVRKERAHLAKLRDERPDLAELVTTEALSLDDAVKKAARPGA